MKSLLFFVLLLFSASFAFAQVPAETATSSDEWVDPGIEVKFKGSKPTISDFLTAILTQQEIGESHGILADDWKKHLSNKPLPKDHSFLVDTKNGYISYQNVYIEEDGPRYDSHYEYCFWNCSDGKHKLVAENLVFLRDGKPFEGQFSGVTFYLYDNETHIMKFAYANDLGLDSDTFYPEQINVIVHSLPRIGKTLTYTFHTPSGKVTKSFTWNGSRFVAD